jgi:hypothetical protein
VLRVQVLVQWFGTEEYQWMWQHELLDFEENMREKEGGWACQGY